MADEVCSCMVSSKLCPEGQRLMDEWRAIYERMRAGEATQEDFDRARAAYNAHVLRKLPNPEPVTLNDLLDEYDPVGDPSGARYERHGRRQVFGPRGRWE